MHGYEHVRCTVFCFFQQKTAYERRISDWSSDVCSSDLVTVAVNLPLNADLAALGDPASAQDVHAVIDDFKSVWVPVNIVRTLFCVQIGRASCRERVCQSV